MHKQSFDLSIASDCAIVIRLKGDKIALRNQQVQRVVTALNEAKLTWLKDYIPAYDTVVIVFDMWQVDHHQVIQQLTHIITPLLSVVKEVHSSVSRHFDMPIWYCDDPQQTDLAKIASNIDRSVVQTIALHTSLRMQVYAIGFLPEFVYLGELPEQLCTPRLAKPRASVPRGALAIADRQCAIYPQVSPGGWHIMGFAAQSYQQRHGCLPKVGDTVQFQAIDKATFLSLQAQIA